MKKSRQFWQDVDLAICSLILQELLRQIIVEGRHTRPEVKKGAAHAPDHDRILFRYHEAMMARFQNHHGHMHNLGI